VSTVKRTARNLGSLTVAKVAVRTAGLVLTAFLVRHIGEEDFGRYNLARSFALMFAVLAKMGVLQITVRDVAGHREWGPRYASTGFTLLVAQSAAMVALILGLAYVLGYRDEQLLGIGVMSVAVSAMCFEAFGSAIFAAHEQLHIEAVFLLVRQVIWSILAVIGIALGFGYLYFLWGLLITSVLMAVLTLSSAQRRFFRFRPGWDPATARALFFAGLPLALSAILVDLYLRLDVVMLDQMTDAVTVGQYAAAFRLISTVTFLAMSFYAVLFPVFSRMEANASDRLAWAFDQSLRVVSIALVPICILGVFWAPWLMTTVFGEPFRAAAPVLAIAIWATALQGIAVLSGRMLVAKGRQVITMWISAVSLLVNVALNYLLIPTLGMIGAATASVVTQALVSIGSWYLLVRLLGRSEFPLRLAGIIGAGLAMAVVLRLTESWSMVGGSLLALSVFLAVLVPLRAAGRSDLELVRSLTRR